MYTCSSLRGDMIDVLAEICNNISANLVRTIEQLYDKALSVVQINGSMGEWFRSKARMSSVSQTLHHFS